VTTQRSDSAAGSVGAIIVAAGQSLRMGGYDKMLAPLAGQPLLLHSVRAFATCAAVDTVVVVASAANEEEIRSLTAAIPAVRGVVRGGSRRRDSVRAGLEALPDCDYVIIHDGARPFVTRELIEAALAGARATGAALCALPVTDTVKREEANGLVRATLSREGLWLAQTPQAFRRDLLVRAHAVADIDATDDAALVEILGEPVRLVPGSARNLKVTTADDLALASAIAAGTA
jgi:2-C-methyl-D-erythritol 4-phosphate cytidylyltransferase